MPSLPLAFIIVLALSSALALLLLWGIWRLDRREQAALGRPLPPSRQSPRSYGGIPPRASTTPYDPASWHPPVQRSTSPDSNER